MQFSMAIARNGKRLLDKSTSFDTNDTRNEVMAKLSEALEANGQDASSDSRDERLKMIGKTIL